MKKSLLKLSFVLLCMQSTLLFAKFDLAWLAFKAPKQPDKQPLIVSDKQYFRKSISSPDSVIFLSNDDDYINDSRAQTRLQKAMRLKRFDFNPLPQSIQQSFTQALLALESPTIESVKQLIEAHIAQDIKQILQDPSVQKKRLNTAKQGDAYTFESSKGNSYSLTADELAQLYNSAFIYVPYIEPIDYEVSVFTQVEKDKKEKKKKKTMKRIKVHLSGGLLWYQVVIRPDFSVSITFIEDTRATVDTTRVVSIFTKSERVIKKAIQDAYDDWASAMASRSRHLDHFRLKGDIHAQDGRDLELAVFKNEGVVPNHYFWLMLDSEDNGMMYSEAKGLAYVTKPGKRREDRLRYSHAYQVYGEADALYSWVEEVPLTGVDFQFGVLHTFDFLIDADDAVYNNKSLFNADINAATGLQFLAAKDLSPLLKKTQRYLEIDSSILYYAIDSDYNGAAYGFDYYLGYRARHWLKNWGISYYVKLGKREFAIDYSTLIDKFRMNSFQYKVGVSIEKMIRPLMMLSFSAYMAEPIGDVDVSIINGDDSQYVSAAHSDFGEMGLSVSLRIIR